jgi:hypothetical protein
MSSCSFRGNRFGGKSRFRDSRALRAIPGSKGRRRTGHRRRCKGYRQAGAPRLARRSHGSNTSRNKLESPLRFGENCGFDMTVEFDETFTVWVFGDHELIQIEISDAYTNRSTAFTFQDAARYSIRFDYATKLAFHEGMFWQVNVEGPGIEVLDVGSFP